jgi:site-specific DNA-methyltransferase (adenine-specific)
MENILQEFLNKIIENDSLTIMKRIPSGSIDVTFADPPFNLKKSYNHYDDKKNIEEYLAWCKKWLYEMVRITKDSGSIFVHNIPKWLTYYAAYLNEISTFKHWIAWDAMGAPLGKTILPNHYGILWYVKSTNFKYYDIRSPHRTCRECKALLKDYGGKKQLIHPFGTLISDVWTDIYRVRHTKRRDEHPCQLPIHLLERLILMTTDVGDVVLDPFIGTGTTAIAAKQLARNYIGIDIDKKYVDITEEKLKKVTQTKINECYLSLFLNKVISVRDVDYLKVEPFLKTRELKINANKSKQLTLPYLKKNLAYEYITNQLDDLFDNTEELVILKAKSESQIKLFEKHASYNANKTKKK